MQTIKVDSARLGGFVVTTDANDNVVDVDQKRSAEIANYKSGFFGIGKVITLNTSVNWADPSMTLAINQNGNSVQYDLLAATAFKVGAASVTAAQFMDLTILHELEHSFGGGHPETDADAYDRGVWRDCFK